MKQLIVPRFTLAATLVLMTALTCPAQTAPAGKPLPVTVDNFTRAESDNYFATFALKEGGFGKFFHKREPAPIQDQTVIRLNRDTLYSGAVFDLDAGPVTITLPDAGKRFMSMMVVDEDHYIHGVYYGAGSHTLSKSGIGTRYVLVGIRILVDPANPQDVQEVHALQDAIKVSQEKPGTFEIPAWDKASQKKVRDALLVLASTLPDMRKAFGSKEEVDPIRHLIGSASAWGGNPDKDALYLNVTPPKNDGKTPYVLTVKDVPVDGFWSVSVYDAKGYYEPNKENAYSLNSITAQKGVDGSVTIHFGGSNKKADNYLPIVPGWNYMVRLYRPQGEVLEGKWQFPQAEPVK